MFQYKDFGIIIKAVNFGEADKILTILTKNKGKIRALAKGIRRPSAKFSGSLEPFNFCHLLIIQGKNDLDLIIGAEVVRSFKNLKRNLEKTATAYLFAELLDKLIEIHEPQKQLFNEFFQALKKLNTETKIDLTLLKDYFLLKTLDILGYRPEIKICQICHQKIKGEGDYFSPNLGGVICARCHSRNGQAVPIKLETLKIIQLFLVNDINIIDKISPKEKNDLSKILELFLTYITDKKLNSLKFFKHLLEEKR